MFDANPGRERASAPRLLVLAAFCCLALACVSRGLDLDAYRIVDLSHPFDAETIYWPTEEGFVLEPGFEGVTEGGYYYAANAFRSAEHGGTHIDAPRHFAEGQVTVDEIPLEKLVGEGIVVDVSIQCERARDYLVRVDDFLAWEALHGAIEPGSIVLLHTGFGARWPDRERYMGTAERGAAGVEGLHFPGLHPEAASWLVEERVIAAVGLDTPSIDHGPSKGFESHRVLFARDVPAFENVAHLDALPPRGFSVIALPMKIRGGSGGPLRIIGLVPRDAPSSGAP
ncbi:MAG: cyclase family protein [Deltaproteobacteria bacterium]|nr:cyclase family protein [Deltaproteobacteria bacterium]